MAALLEELTDARPKEAKSFVFDGEPCDEEAVRGMRSSALG
ncbi:MAG: hypothetical protein AAF585_07120 [Verrucomicrobiota bacterium]